jgi:predicted unusual protein kinase regulating ubiquinone biosynthesis (AarF/ABC1/UbiB family)
LEDVHGIKINDYEAITSAGIRREDVASRLLDTYLKQIFEDGFFHADPHPGNLFVATVAQGDHALDRNCSGWVLTFVDFGMVGRLPHHVFDGLRELVVAVGTRNTGGVLRASQKLGFIIPGADIDLLERAEEKLFDKFWGKNMMEISQVNPAEMMDFAREFREVLYILPFQIPQDIIFLGRAVGILSGMCTGLNPTFNVWDHLVPYAKKLISEEIRSPEKWIEAIEKYLRRVIELPNRIESVINKLERGEISVHEVELALQVRRMENTIRHLTAAIMFFTLFIGGVLFYRQGELALSTFLIVFSIVVFLVLSRRT